MGNSTSNNTTTSLMDRIRKLLRDVEQGLQSRPHDRAAQEFRNFLVREIDTLEDRNIHSARPNSASSASMRQESQSMDSAA